MSKSENNLLEAFAGESQANRKYLAFAKQAERDGYDQAARLFRAAAAAAWEMDAGLDVLCPCSLATAAAISGSAAR